jgi:hypothetical protein
MKPWFVLQELIQFLTENRQVVPFVVGRNDNGAVDGLTL